MHKYGFNLALGLGALAIAWVGFGFWGNNLLALWMTVLIAVAYAFGVHELRQFRRNTLQLIEATQDVAAPVNELADWLSRVPAALQHTVRLRVQGEHLGLPGPAMTPYLVGLLVMLGMLGTFLGMVVTLNGAVFALEGTTSVQAIRAAFSEPIKGLGLAFGTSVAGVASSAALGLMSALCRRERMHAGQLLDALIATHLRSFSLSYQRQQAFKALPQVLEKLQDMMNQMTQTNQQLSERLLDNQEHFHRAAKGAYTELASSVHQSLQDSLQQSAQTASDSMMPALESALTSMASEARGTQQQLLNTWMAALEHQGTQQAQWAAQVSEKLVHQAQQHAHQMLDESRRLAGISESLIQTRIDTEAQWIAQHGERLNQMATVLRNELSILREEEAARGQAAVQRLAELQEALAHHLSTLGTALEAPITRLIQTASEAPRAAAEVIGKLREEVSHSVARDNELLEERGRILDTLKTLLDSIRHASAEQQNVMSALVGTSAQVNGSAIEVAALGETLGFAVKAFSESNAQLTQGMQRIEQALDKSMVRSDEQLAYYVAQAREVIDLSMASHKDIFEALRQLERATP